MEISILLEVYTTTYEVVLNKIKPESDQNSKSVLTW